MTYSALFCSVVNKNLCLTPLQDEVSTLTRAQRGEARLRARSTTQPSAAPPELGFLAQKGQIWSHLELGGAGEGFWLLYTLIYDFATLR